MPSPDPLQCEFCPRVSENRQGRSAHMRWCENNPKRLTQAPARKTRHTNGVDRVKPLRSTRKILEAEKDLVAMVTLAYPHGIPTTDQDRLEDDLRWIAHTSRVLGRK